ncbi:DUF2975 domain-containing protein [Lysinibacillus sp. NPDC059133]|uniref:DUF2975 domain-containing protein n=1 Tax=Lysinibacillus sp. NPDC059133 TaxID=3346737 RepID=UPI0036AD265E
MKQKELSAWLKLIIILCGIFGVLFCVYIAPEIGKNFLQNSKQDLYNFFIGFIWITGIPFFIALALGWQICSDIASDQVFTIKNADRLKYVGILSMIEGVFYIAALMYLFIIGSYQTDLLMIILLILFFSVVISVFTSLLSHLVRKASEIKQDNDLTI